MLSLSPNYKLQYFNRNIIKTNWKKINETPVKKAGLLVRRIARGSIRRTKSERPSKPGTPPRARTNRRGGTSPFKMIYSVTGRYGATAVVGMVAFGKPSGSAVPVPGLQEHGGIARRRVFVKVGQRRTKKGRFGRNIRKPKYKMVRYPARPFMQPALEKAKDRMPPLWRNSLSR